MDLLLGFAGGLFLLALGIWCVERAAYADHIKRKKMLCSGILFLLMGIWAALLSGIGAYQLPHAQPVVQTTVIGEILPQENGIYIRNYGLNSTAYMDIRTSEKELRTERIPYGDLKKYDCGKQTPRLEKVTETRTWLSFTDTQTSYRAYIPVKGD